MLSPLFGGILLSAVNCCLYSICPVHFVVGDSRLLRAPCTHHIFYEIHAHGVCVLKAQSIFPTVRKRSEPIWHAFIAFISALKSKIDLYSFNWWLWEKLDCVSEVSSWILLLFLFTYLFLVTQVIMMPTTCMGFKKSPAKNVNSHGLTFTSDCTFTKILKM